MFPLQTNPLKVTKGPPAESPSSRLAWDDQWQPSLAHLPDRLHRTEGVRVTRAKLDRACRRLGRLAHRGSPARVERALASYQGWAQFF